MKRKFNQANKNKIPGANINNSSSLKNFWRKNSASISKFILPVIILLIVGSVIVIAQWLFLNRRGDSFVVGKPSPETYRVIASVRYDDQEVAENLRTMVRDSVAGVSVMDVSAKSRLKQRLENIKNNKPSSKLPEPLVKAIYNLSETERTRILNLTYQVGSSYFDRLSSEGVLMDSSAETSILWDEINKNVKSSNDANLIYQILSRFGNLMLHVDEELTELAKEAAMRDVPVLDRRLEPGDVIVSRGEIVTEQTANLLRLQGYTEDLFPFLQLCVVFACVLMLPLWLNIFSYGAGDKKPSWWCAVFIIIVAWTCEALCARFRINGAGVLPAVVLSYVCIPDYLGFCMSLIATYSGLFIITGQAISDSILLAVMSLIASTAGFYFLRRLESRKQISRKTFALAMLLIIIRMLMRYLMGSPLTQDSFRLFVPLGIFWKTALRYLAAEILLTHFIMILLPFIENYIGVLSAPTLREVSHPSNPLLRDLQRNAPGTYQHSLTIATLIEAVGMKLNMDVNLLRAGAYYHDIGKLRRPQFFVENQGGGHNIHDEMSPMLSAITIISHVKDGLELAWEAKLPGRIQDFIAEHHGTTCTRYFYNKAVAAGENVEWSSFCYPGPKPQSRETALLMITDSVEAAVRAANIRDLGATDNNHGKGQAYLTVEKIVNQVINSKINEKQFEEVNFTQKDFNIIKETLINVLLSMYHTRRVKKIEKKN